MQIKLYSKPIREINPKVQVALNRGIEPKDIEAFFKHQEQDINPAEAFGEDLLKQGARMLMGHVSADHDVVVIVDSDVDGWTSSALLINYLTECFPSWVTNHLTWALHEGKQHGLADHIAALLECNYSLVICPDSATNDIEYIKELHEDNTDVLILDHHLSDVPMSEFAVTINSQYNYPNPQLSGVGVVYQFCKFLDKIGGNDYADNYLDLVAIGLMGDMMDIRSLESKQLMFKGFKDKSLRNPLIAGLANKAEFALSKPDYAPSPNNNLAITPMGAAFFIIPLLNALSRSGTMEEKELVFESMLTIRAFEQILSNKRGHKLGEMERRVDQALRCCTNVKNRQTRAEDAGMALLTSQAETMLDNKVLVFCLEPGQIDPNIAGLVANKLMAKYQRPVCVTTRNTIYKDGFNGPSVEELYQGSMRGYTATGVNDFKAVAETSSACNWVRGHENAAGISLNDPGLFVDNMNEALKDVSTDIVYWVDYTWSADNINNEAIIDLAELNDYLGTGFARPLVHVHDCLIDSFMIMKDVHLKINLPGGCSAIMWNADAGLLERLKDGEVVKINFVAKCNINEFNWERNPQLIIEDYEEIKATVTESWGF